MFDRLGPDSALSEMTRSETALSATEQDAILQAAVSTGAASSVISLYLDAAVGEAEAFNLTHAYIHALEANDPRRIALRQRLVDLGAEQP